MLTYLLVTAAISGVYLSGLMDPDPAPPPEPPIPPSKPWDVMEAFLDEIASQSRRREGKIMRKALSEHAVVTGRTWSALELPCHPGDSYWRPRDPDQTPADGSPEESYWERIASTLAQSNQVDYSVVPAGLVPVRRHVYTMCVVLFYTKGTVPPLIEWQGRDFQGAWAGLRAQAYAEAVRDARIFAEKKKREEERRRRRTLIGTIPSSLSPGQIVTLIVSTVIQAGVGTVTALGAQGLIRSMGGERRLARLMRRYRRTGSPRIRRKIVRTASRLKGRTVNWAEVEQILAEPPPSPLLAARASAARPPSSPGPSASP